MRKTSIVLLAGALAIVASLIVGPTATAGKTKASAATVVFIHDQEPPNLQGPWVGNNLYATQLVLNNIWYGGQIRNDKGDFVPRLFAAAPKILKQKPLTVQATFKDSANWSDGKPVTGQDFVATGYLIGQRMIKDHGLKSGDLVFAPVEAPTAVYATLRY